MLGASLSLAGSDGDEQGAHFILDEKSRSLLGFDSQWHKKFSEVNTQDVQTALDNAFLMG